MTVALVRNDREEWELLGGRLELGEIQEECVFREVHEELGITVVAERLVDAWVYPVEPTKSVLVVAFGCAVRGPLDLRLSDEHSELLLADDGPQLEELPVPEGYPSLHPTLGGLGLILLGFRVEMRPEAILRRISPRIGPFAAVPGSTRRGTWTRRCPSPLHRRTRRRRS